MAPRVRKVATGTRRPKGPSRPTIDNSGAPAEAQAAGNPKCWAGCGHPAVEYKHHQWWCRRHTPVDRLVGCTHQVVSPFHDKLLCSFCGEFVKEEL